jgi:hypothetical protein
MLALALVHFLVVSLELDLENAAAGVPVKDGIGP